MDFLFTDEQNLLRDSVRKFVEKDYGFETRRGLLKSELGYSKDNWRSMAELGWTALPFSEADGGLGGKAVDTMIVLEEFGKGLVLEPYLPSIVFAGGLLRRAGDAVKQRFLPSLIGGETTAAVAYAEPESRFELAQVATSAKRDGDGFVLNGKKIAVFAGHAADVLVVSARTAGARGERSGITLFAIDAKAPGVQRQAYATVDGLRAANVSLEGVKVGKDQIVGELDSGLALLEAVSDEVIIALAAEATGIMEVLYKSTVAYTKERKQFGVPIASFQVLQHRMVDQFMEYEQFKSLMYWATMCQDAQREVSKAASSLKIMLSRSGKLVGQAAIQNHGGMGMTEELAVSHYFKRLTMIDLTLGNGDYHLDRYRALPVAG
ncbi:MAG TPA: acyl-CoA dehydrogenase family protein [Polyangiales bacterium]|nr:acyl-CoA dehydrogenase family protein [Polyangiales bacterium]